MLGETLFALCYEDTVFYEICVYRNHFFRRYPDCSIERADQEDISAAKQFGY